MKKNIYRYVVFMLFATLPSKLSGCFGSMDQLCVENSSELSIDCSWVFTDSACSMHQVMACRMPNATFSTSKRSIVSRTGCRAWSVGSRDLCTFCSQVATACSGWRQSVADEEIGGDMSSNDNLQLPFWLLAKPKHGSWQAEPLPAWKRVSC